MNDAMALEEYNNYLNQPDNVRLAKLGDYVISRGARDCSIMITIAQVEQWKSAPPSCFLIQLISFNLSLLNS